MNRKARLATLVALIVMSSCCLTVTSPGETWAGTAGQTPGQITCGVDDDGAATPLVANGSFESDNVGVTPQGWFQGGDADFQVSDEDASDGAHSLYISSPNGGGHLDSAPFSVNSGQRYHVSMGASLTGTPHLALRFFDNSNALISTPWTPVSSGSSGWSTIDWTVEAPPDAVTATLRLLTVTGHGVAGYVDDVDAEATAVTVVGEPVHITAVNRAAVVNGTLGPIAYVPMNGNPDAEVVQLNLDDGQIVATGTAAGAGLFSSAVTGPNGEVYLTGNKNGHLYRMDLGIEGLTDLGAPDSNEHSLFTGTVGPGGDYYVGSQPHGHLYRYDVSSETFFDYGQISANHSYLFDVASVGGSLYLGLGTTGAKIIRIDPVTGATLDVPLPTPYQAFGSVRALDARGDYLFARVAGAPDGAGPALLVWSTLSDQWVDLGRLGGANEVISDFDSTGRVWFRGADGHLRSYNPVTEDVDDLQVVASVTVGWMAKGMGVVQLDVSQHPGDTVVMVGYDGTVSYYNIQTNSSWSSIPNLPSPAEAIRSILATQDGKIYVSGYQNGQLASYDISTGIVDDFPRGLTGGQVESMIEDNGTIYVGTYSGAGVSAIDPTAQSSTLIGNLASSDQDRPFAMAWAGDRIAVGTVPIYGELGGALSFVDPVAGTVDVHRNVVQDQSVTAIAATGSTLIAGTSVAGGLGSTPTESSARLITWDLNSDDLVSTMIPVPGDVVVATLMAAPNGNVWGATLDTIFEFDPSTGVVVRTVSYADPFQYNGGNAWGDTSSIGFLPDGQIWLNSRGIYFIDTNTLAVTKVVDGMAHAVMGSDGNLYFNENADSGQKLYRLEITCGSAMPLTGGTVAGPVQGTMRASGRS